MCKVSHMLCEFTMVKAISWKKTKKIKKKAFSIYNEMSGNQNTCTAVFCFCSTVKLSLLYDGNFYFAGTKSIGIQIKNFSCGSSH